MTTCMQVVYSLQMHSMGRPSPAMGTDRACELHSPAQPKSYMEELTRMHSLAKDTLILQECGKGSQSAQQFTLLSRVAPNTQRGAWNKGRTVHLTQGFVFLIQLSTENHAVQSSQ